jgi:succinyl-CoA synthetase beta subunit
VTIDPATGLMPHHARRIAYGLGLEGDQVRKAVKFIDAIYRAFVELDASVIEINPLMVTGKGEVVALDAKINFDDNALYRHKDVEELRDEDEEDRPSCEAGPQRTQLRQARRQYRLHGQRRRARHGDDGHHQALWRRAGQLPRCRRRRNQGAGRRRVQDHPLRSATSKGILVNIFGGIMRCDVIAEGVVAAARELSLARALGGAARRHQRRARQEDPAPNPACPSLRDNLADAAEKAVKAVKEAA